MRRSLVSLAVVTAMWEQRRHDYLDNFVPFIATLLNSLRIRRINRDQIRQLCDQFDDEFGLKLPFHPMVSVLNRCVRRHLLRRSHGGFNVNRKVSAELAFGNKRHSYIQKERDLLSQFSSYAKNRFGECIDISDAEATLLMFLRRFDMEIVISKDGAQSALPERPKGKRHRRLLYMLNRFAIDAHDSGDSVFSTLCDMAIGHMLTAAVMLDEYDWPSDTVRASNIYLDAPVILILIGAKGKDQADVFAGLLSDLGHSGAKLWVFEHSRQEVMNVLEGARYWVNRPDYDPELASITALYFKQEGYDDSEIERFILRLDDTLIRYNIGVFGDHEYIEKQSHQIDEVQLRTVIEKCYAKSDGRFDPEKREASLLKDVASVAAVYRLREGKKGRQLRDVKHVFMSTNSALARASQAVVNGPQSFQAVPVCVTDVFLGTLVWVNSPRQAREAHRKRLIGECYAAIAPNSALETRIVREARRLLDRQAIDEDDYLLLTTSFITKDLLSEKTLGDPDVIDSRTSFELLEDVKTRIRSEERERTARAEVERRKEQLARERAEAERDEIVTNIRRAAKDFAERKIRMVRAIVWVGVGVAGLMPVVPGTLVHIGWVAISGLAALVTIYLGLGKGFTVKRYLGKLRAKFEREYRSRHLSN